MSAGAIAGIVVGCTVALALFMALAIVIYKRRSVFCQFPWSAIFNTFQSCVSLGVYLSLTRIIP